MDTTKTISIKFFRDQAASAIGLVALSVYDKLDKTSIAPNFSSEGLQNISQGFMNGLDLVWASFWGITVITLWRFIRPNSVRTEQVGTPPDHIL